MLQEFLWEFYGTTMGIYGKVWEFMGIYGNMYGKLLEIVGMYGNDYGKLWETMGVFNTVWELIKKLDCVMYFLVLDCWYGSKTYQSVKLS